MKTKRFIQPDDLYNMVTVETPRLSPDGETVAFVRMTRRRDDNAILREIWLVNADGSHLHQLTTSQKQDRAPAWSPDGERLAFISNRDGKNQLYVIRTDGGEAQQLTHFANGVSGYPAWSPKGEALALLVAMRADEMDAEDNDTPPAAPEPPDPMVFDDVPVDFKDSGRVAQLYVVAAEPNSAKKTARIGRAAPRNGYSSPQWLPDGETLISTNSHKPAHDAPWTFQQAVTVRAADATVTAISEPGYRAYDPLPSPDGKTVAIQYRPGNLPVNRVTHLGIIPAAGGVLVSMTDTLDRTLELHAWSAEGDALYFTARHAGFTPLYRVAATSDSTPQPIDVGHCTITGLDAGANRRVVFSAFREDGTHEVYLHNGTDLHQLTTFNAAWLAEVTVSLPEEIHYQAADGQDLQGWLMKPAAYDPAQTYPLALNIHGGPSLMYGPASPSLWLEWQHHVASGYGVFYCNPRGSTGYGEAFLLANQANWGELPAGDVLAGVDTVLAQADWIDAKRLVLTGGSYGGYLTVWIIAHDDRFAAAVSQRGPYSMLSFHGTTDIPVFVSSNMQDEPWDNPQRFLEQSPTSYTSSINTPLLIIHSEKDTRVPVSEAIQLFTLLRRQGKNTQLVVFPDEGHELSRSGKPRRMIERLRRIVDWWDTYCNPTPPGQGE